MNIKLLDCTLRDGAHVNKGNFGYNNIEKIIEGLIKSKIDIIEIGFLEDCEYDRDFTFFDDIDRCDELLLDKENANTEFALMARPDRCDSSRFDKPCGKITAIRFAFYNDHLNLALKYAEIANSQGYKVYFNPINITSYSSSDLKLLINSCNEVDPQGISIVDTFGSLNLKLFQDFVTLMNNNLRKDIQLGIHLHENLSLSFGMVQNYLLNINSKRDIIIDASLLGMGRIPGNLPIELICSYLNNNDKSYDISPILDLIEEIILPIKKKRSWGYSPEYLISAIQGVHRSYPEFFVEDNGLSLSECNMLINQVSADGRAEKFDDKYASMLINMIKK